MSELRAQFEKELEALPDVTLQLYKDSSLLCVAYRGKEFAHFHDANEIDVRLSRKFIRAEGLSPPEASSFHPTRSKNSRWMQLQFYSEEEAEALLALIKRLIAAEYEPTDWSA